MEASVMQQKSRMAEMEELLKSEMAKIKGDGTVVQQSVLDQFTEVSRNIQEKSALADTRLNESLEVVHGHTKQLEKLQGLSDEKKKKLENTETEFSKTKNKTETTEAELTKIQFKVNTCVEDLAKMDQFAKVTEVRKLEKELAEKSGSSEAKEVQEKLSKLRQETTDSLREMNQKQTSLGVALSGVQAEVKKLADMGGVTEDLGVISSKVNQQKAKLIDLEANVALQERSNGKLSEDFKKMSETLTENKASVDQKLEKLEGTKKELVLTVSDMGKANTTLGQELASLTGLKTKAPVWDRKAETTEVDRLNTLLTEEVNKIQKEMKELRKKAEEIQTEASSKKEPTEPEAGQVQMKELDSNFSRLSDIVESLQGRLTSQQENSALELEQVQVSIRGLRKGLDTLSHESKQSGALGMIDKQRRGWEEAREKAEQMSQIFDSLIITNDRPYVSCGLDLAATCPGLIDFAQFELINKVVR